MDHFVSRTTQLVVGAAGESDRELLTTTQAAYRDLGLSRVYYSRFKPWPDTPLEGHEPESLEREHRLYQADMLIRDYGFDVEDLPLRSDDRLPLSVDPKRAWAAAHPEMYPLEVNDAPRQDLLKVPGLGPKGADAIVAARKKSPVSDEAQLRRLGIRVAPVLPWITIGGKYAPRQIPLPPPIGIDARA
jgi:predicted DNA-binding helix-hairpin-helix protein